MSRGAGTGKSVVRSMRLKDDEHDALLAEAKALGIPVSEFLRRAVVAEIEFCRRARALRAERIQQVGQGQTVGNTAGWVEVSP